MLGRGSISAHAITVVQNPRPRHQHQSHAGGFVHGGISVGPVSAKERKKPDVRLLARSGLNCLSVMEREIC